MADLPVRVILLASQWERLLAREHAEGCGAERYAGCTCGLAAADLEVWENIERVRREVEQARRVTREEEHGDEAG